MDKYLPTLLHICYLRCISLQRNQFKIDCDDIHYRVRSEASIVIQRAWRKRFYSTFKDRMKIIFDYASTVSLYYNGILLSIYLEKVFDSTYFLSLNQIKLLFLLKHTRTYHNAQEKCQICTIKYVACIEDYYKHTGNKFKCHLIQSHDEYTKPCRYCDDTNYMIRPRGLTVTSCSSCITFNHHFLKSLLNQYRQKKLCRICMEKKCYFNYQICGKCYNMPKSHATPCHFNCQKCSKLNNLIKS